MQSRDWWPTMVWNWYEQPNFGLLMTNIIQINPENNHQETIKGDVARPQRQYVQHHYQGR